MMALERTNQERVEELVTRNYSQTTYILNTISAFGKHKELTEPYQNFLTNLVSLTILYIKQN